MLSRLLRWYTFSHIHEMLRVLATLNVLHMTFCVLCKEAEIEIYRN